MAGAAPPRLPDPSRPPQRQPRGHTQQQANAATLMALIGLLLLSFALIGLVALVLPQVRGLLLVLFGAIGFFAFHYIAWGWWLPKMLPKEDESDGGTSP